MKKLAMFLGIALVIVGAAAAYLWREAAVVRDQNTVAAARTSAMESAQLPASPAIPAMQDSPGAVQGSAAGAGLVAQSGAAEAMPAGRGQVAGSAANPFAEAIRQLQNSPESQEATRIMMRPMLEQKFEDLAKEMNLTADMAGKVLDLLARRQMEEAAEMFDTPEGPEDRAAGEQRMRAEAKSEQAFQSELSNLLGSSYPKWAEYERKVEDRQRAMYTRMGQEQLRNTINAGGTPLTDAQFQYLNKALDAEQRRIDQETTSPGQQLERLPETNRRLVEVASAHLNPQQLEQYRRYLQQQEEFMNSMDGMGILR